MECIVPFVQFFVRIDINNLEREFVEILTNAVCTDIYLTNYRAWIDSLIYYSVIKSRIQIFLSFFMGSIIIEKYLDRIR
jgi:hypothetical protein